MARRRHRLEPSGAAPSRARRAPRAYAASSPRPAATTSSSETSRIAAPQPPVGAGPGDGRSTTPAAGTPAPAGRRPATPPSSISVGNGTPRHSRGVGRRQPAGSPSPPARPATRHRPGGEDQQPLQHPHRAGPDRDPGRAEVGGAEGRVEPVAELVEARGRRPAHGAWPRAGPGRPRPRRPAPAPRCRPGPAAPGSASGTEVRAAPVSCLPAAPRSRWSRLSGSGLSRESHAVTGQPVARLARSRVDSSTACDDGRDTRRRRRRRPRARRPAPASSRSTLARPVTSSSRSAAARTSASSRVRVAFLAATRPAISALQLGDADAVPGADGEHRHAGEAVRVEQPADVGEHRLAPRLRHGVDVVEHDQHHVLVAGQRREVAVVDRGVGVLLRVEHPHQQVGELDQPVDLEVVGDLGRVVVGQVEQDDALEVAGPRAAGVEHRVADDPVPRRDAEPVEQLVGAVGPPHAGGRPRRGRAAYADGGEVEPVSALNVEDLPEPVAPAIATTVWSAESRSRPAARSTTAAASSTRASSSRPRAASVAASRPSIRAPMSVPRVTSLLAPSSKDVIVSLGSPSVLRPA